MSGFTALRSSTVDFTERDTDASDRAYGTPSNRPRALRGRRRCKSALMQIRKVDEKIGDDLAGAGEQVRETA